MKADQSLIEFKKGIVDEYGMYQEDYEELKSYVPDSRGYSKCGFIVKDYDEEFYRMEEEMNKEAFSSLRYEDVYSDEEYEKDLEIERGIE